MLYARWMPVQVAADRRSPAAPSPVSTPFGAKVLRQRSEGGRLCRIRPVSPNCPELCRFSDAGDDEADHRLEDRRLKSAEARNRGKWGHRRCRGLCGDLAAASGWAKLVRAPAQLLCLAGWVWVTGRTSAAGVAGQGWRCHCGRIYRPAVSGGYAGRASQNGERHWAGGSGVRAL